MCSHVLGDFNTYLLNAEMLQLNERFLSFVAKLFFYSYTIIDKPTRVSTNSTTLINSIFVNQIGREITSGNTSISDISELYSQSCMIKSFKIKELPKKTMYRKFSRNAEENSHSELSEINWDLAMIKYGDNANAVS